MTCLPRVSSFSFLAAESDERGGMLRRRITLICADYTGDPAQGRMTVLRRGEAPSNLDYSVAFTKVARSQPCNSPVCATASMFLPAYNINSSSRFSPS
jgi:hypothetical protein